MSAPAFAPIKGSPPSIEWQPVAALRVDPAYQRPTDGKGSRSAIRAIAAGWDWRLCEPLTVSRRLPDATLYVVDGQHRLAAAALRGDIPHLPCCITSFGGVQEEAALFVAANRGRRPITRFDDHRAAVATGDPQAVALDSVIRNAGLSIAAHGKASTWQPGEIGAIAGVRTAIRIHGRDAASGALATLYEAYSDQPLVYAGTILGALYPIFGKPPPDFDPDRLFDILSARTQAEWIRTIPGGAAAGGRGQAHLRDTLLKLYREKRA